MPELHLPSARNLSICAIWEHLLELDRSLGAPRWRLVGSSLGGWLAGRFARHTGRVDRAVLLSSPLHLRGLWDRVLSDEARAQWKARGSMLFPDVHGKLQRVGYSFYEDVVAMGGEANGPLPCPALVVHGARDVLLSVEESREQASLSGAELVVLDDDHELTSSVPEVTARVIRFFDEGDRVS